MNDNPLKIKISVNTEELNRLMVSIASICQPFAGSYLQAERDRRWREDPLGLMPYLRFWGLRCMVADGLRAIADWIEG